MRKKWQRILALIGAILLFGMYVVVLILGLTGNENTIGMLMGAIACTIIIPVLLYAMQMIARVLGRRGDNEELETGDGSKSPSGAKPSPVSNPDVPTK